MSTIAPPSRSTKHPDETSGATIVSQRSKALPPLIQILKAAGLKATVPRVRVLRFLQQNGHRHVGVDTIHAGLAAANEEVCLATIYRVVAQFESVGVVLRLRLDDGRSMFELNQGPHHDHMVCVQCGAVEEFVDHSIEDVQYVLVQARGFQIAYHVLNLYGVCEACQVDGRVALDDDEPSG